MRAHPCPALCRVADGCRRSHRRLYPSLSFSIALLGMHGPAWASAQPVQPVAARLAGDDSGERDRDQPTWRPARPTSRTEENALRAGVLGSGCACRRRPALSLHGAAGRRCGVIPTRRAGPRLLGLLHPLFPRGRRAVVACARVAAAAKSLDIASAVQVVCWRIRLACVRASTDFFGLFTKLTCDRFV